MVIQPETVNRIHTMNQRIINATSRKETFETFMKHQAVKEKYITDITSKATLFIQQMYNDATTEAEREALIEAIQDVDLMPLSISYMATAV
jgi:hypothetical protein